MRLHLAVVLCLISCGLAKPPELPGPPEQVSGAALFVDLSPANRPALVGALDFELLGGGKAKACVVRGDTKHYWVAVAGVERIAPDRLTQQAIAAAITDAIQRLNDVDAILLTSVTTEAKGANTVCAEVSGRGIKFLKAAPGATASVAPPPTPPQPSAPHG